VRKNYMENDKTFADERLSFNPYVSEGPAYNALELVKKLLGWFKGSGKYYGETEIEGEMVHLADSDYIGNMLGRKAGKINLGAYNELTDQIFLHPAAGKGVFYHEIGHKLGLDEKEADEYALKRLGVLN